jgi:hypothetical protein
VKQRKLFESVLKNLEKEVESYSDDVKAHVAKRIKQAVASPIEAVRNPCNLGELPVFLAVKQIPDHSLPDAVESIRHDFLHGSARKLLLARLLEDKYGERAEKMAEALLGELKPISYSTSEG